MVFVICQEKWFAEYYSAFASPHKCYFADCGRRIRKNRIGALGTCYNCNNRKAIQSAEAAAAEALENVLSRAIQRRT